MTDRETHLLRQIPRISTMKELRAFREALSDSEELKHPALINALRARMDALYRQGDKT